MGTFRLEIQVKIKITQYVHIGNFINLLYYTPPFLLGLTIDWKIEDSDGSLECLH